MRELIFVVVLGCAMLVLRDLDLGIRDALDPLKPSTPSSMPDDLQKQLEEFNAIAREMDRTVREARERGNALTGLLALRGIAQERLGQNPMIDQAVATMLMQAEAELGNEQEALAAADIAASTRPLESKSAGPTDGWRPCNAAEAIESLAKDQRVVMINEAHHVPRHRAVTIELLRALRDEGFTHFAAETLYDTDVELAERGFPTIDSGAYIAEPMYASLIREALQLGYIVVPYEASHAGLGGRERGQAENLKKRVFDRDPDARLLVHAGYAHINESGTVAGARTMAQELADMLDIDPLTIDQTVMSQRSAPRFEHPIYRDVVDRFALDQPTVFLNENDEPWTLQPEVRDVTLFLPRSIDEHGRPSWLTNIEGRMAVAIADHAIEETDDVSGLILVSAFQADEMAAPGAIPIDQYVAPAGKPLPPLVLTARDCVVVVEDAEGRRLAEWSVSARE